MSETKTPTSIYGLHGQWVALMAAAESQFDPETGEEIAPDAALDAAFAVLGEDVDAKIAGCGYVLRRLKADAEALRDEEVRLGARRKSLVAARSRLEERVRALMLATDKRRVKTPGVTVTLRKAAWRVEVTGPVPPEYMTTPEPRPALSEIKAAIGDGVELPFAGLVEGTRALVIS